MGTIIVMNMVLLMLPSSPATSQDSAAVDRAYLIEENCVGEFVLGGNIPAENSKYKIRKEIRYGEEASQFPVYVVSNSAGKLLEIRAAFDQKTEKYVERIGEIEVFSKLFRTKDGISVGTNLNDFARKFNDYSLGYMYISGMVVLHTKQLGNIQFLIDTDNVRDPSALNVPGDFVRLKLVDFKKDTRIKSIRVFTF